MKYLLLLFLLPCYVYSQDSTYKIPEIKIEEKSNKENNISKSNSIETKKIDGIGIFKIGITTISIIDSLKNLGYAFKTFTDDIEYLTTYKQIIFEPVEDSLTAYYLVARYPNHKVYFITQYRLLNMYLKHIELNFFNDTLYSFEAEDLPSEFGNNLDLKYGEPKIKVETKLSTCTSALAGNYTLVEKHYIKYYRKDSKIQAYSFLSEYYDDNCKKQYLSYFLMNDIKKTAFIENEEKKLATKRKKQLDENKKKDLKDF